MEMMSLENSRLWNNPLSMLKDVSHAKQTGNDAYILRNRRGDKF